MESNKTTPPPLARSPLAAAQSRRSSNSPQTCDLVISTAGTGLRINSLFKIEAERIVAVYHHYRKETKKAASQPQVIVQQSAVDPMEQLEKLAKLKESGIITQEEFDAKKKELLGL